MNHHPTIEGAFFGALGILSPGYSKLRPGIPKPRVRNWILQAPMPP